MGAMLPEVERGCVIRQGIQIHLEKIHGELAVNVVELVLVFAIATQILRVNLFEVVEVKGAFGVHALMDDEVFPVLLGIQSVLTVGASQGHDFAEFVLRAKTGIANFTDNLSFGSVVLVKVRERGTAAGACAFL